MLVLVPTEGSRRRQLRTLARAGPMARRLGMRMIDIDGSVDAQGEAHLVAQRRAPFLPPA